MNPLIFMVVLSIQTVTTSHTSSQNCIVENSIAGSKTAVTSEFLQGKWRIVEISCNGHKTYSRDTYHFFSDNTGYQGRSQKIEWEIKNNELFLTTYENGNINKTKWKARRNHTDYLILTRSEINNRRGVPITKNVNIKLVKL